MVSSSYAKLNLYLAVLNKRKDHYHNLKTLFERIDLCDTISIKPRRDNRIILHTDSPSIPADGSNLACRAAELIRSRFGIEKGLDIKIKKRIPVGSGMGGGSSNAACVLKMLNKLWKLGLSREKLAGLGKELGADVPFFIYDTGFALAGGRGDRIRPLKIRTKLWHVVIMPKLHIPTPFVYQKWDGLPQKVRLTKPYSDVRLLLLALKKNDLSLINRHLFNDLEKVSLRLFPAVARLKKELIGLGLKAILMSGSGPAVFGIVPSRKEAQSLVTQLKRDRRLKTFITATI